MKRLVKNIIPICILISVSSAVLGQNQYPSLGLWHLKNVSGEIGLLGNYRFQSSLLDDLKEEQNTSNFAGRFMLNTSSYLWDPGIISFDFNGEYNPEFRDEKYLIVPDRSEIRTLSKLDLRATIFGDKNINLTSFYNINNSYFNRENLTNVRSDNKQWGGLFSFNNKILPLNINFRKSLWNQTETDTGRDFSMDQKNIEGRATKSFYNNDKHELKYTYREYRYMYADLNNVENNISRADLNNQFYFDKKRNYSLTSNVSYYDQTGTFDFSRIEANERIMLHLPANFDINGSYNYYQMNDPSQTININRGRASIRHQLFESLNSQVYIDYSGTRHTLYDESSYKGGANFKYSKKTRIGIINIGYHYFRHYNDLSGQSGSINVTRENKILSDLEVIYLDRPYVDEITILITDISSTIIYQEGLDYILNTVNSFTEIIRVPGGQIADNQNVLISYTAIQPGSNTYSANNNTLTSGILMFDRLLEIYYRGSSQSYPSVEHTEYLTLNKYSQNLFGARLYYKFAGLGLEYDYYNSSLIPYERMKYYVNLNIKIKSKLLFTLNGNLRDYKVLDTGVDHRYTNLSARLTYSMSPSTRLNIESSYLNQSGETIHLNLISGKAELIANLRKLMLKGSLNIYQRKYSNSNFVYAGTYFEIIRKF